MYLPHIFLPLQKTPYPFTATLFSQVATLHGQAEENHRGVAFKFEEETSRRANSASDDDESDADMDDQSGDEQQEIIGYVKMVTSVR